MGHNNFTNIPFIARFMKGIFNLRPPVPRYQFTWDVKQVLSYLSSHFPLRSLNLKMLTQKLVTLLALCTAQRAQTLVSLKIDEMIIQGDHVSFSISSIQKNFKTWLFWSVDLCHYDCVNCVLLEF